ncbi:MAG: IS110 family transposase [Phycisphaerales bacterium]
METVPVFIGLDYHTRGVQVCVVDAGGRVLVNRRSGNSVADIAGLVRPEWRVERVAIESCCGAADLAEALIDQAGWSVSLAHPGYVARMRHNPDKTDYADARMLAELARAGLVPPVWLAPGPIRELRLLVRLRADLVARARAVKTQVLATLRLQRIAEPPDARRWTRAWLAWLASPACGLSEQARFAVAMRRDELGQLRARIAGVEARLAEATAGDAVVERLMSVKGVGRVTAWTMRAVIGRFDRFTTGKQLARFCAVTPRNASSGQRVADAGLVRAGDPLLKSVLIEAAHRLRRYEPRWRQLSDSMAARGKPASVIVAAVANRWVRGLHHQMKEPAMAA